MRPERTVNGWMILGMTLGLATAVCANRTWAAGGRQSLPEFSQVQAAVVEHFEALPDYQPGGIITRGEVEPLFKQRGLMGWLGADADAILDEILPDGDPLLRQLRSGAGRKFAGRLTRYPNAYDRLERLRRLPGGKRIVQDLIRGPGGDKLIEYLTTRSGGAEMGRMLSKSPKGTDFNKPTGHIYTVDMLLGRLRTSFNAASGAAEETD